MSINKDQLINFMTTLILIGVSLWVIVPLFLDSLRGKKLGISKKEPELDQLIALKKGIFQNSQSLSKPSNINHDLQNRLQKYLKLNISENKIEAFVLNFKSRKLAELISNSNFEIQLNYYFISYIYLAVADEILSEKTLLTNALAKFISRSPAVTKKAFELQLILTENVSIDYLRLDGKILQSLKERDHNLILNSYIKKMSLQWGNKPDSFFEDISPFLIYADLILKIPNIENITKQNAHLILKLNANPSQVEAKSQYKKLSKIYHPDIISAQKMPHLIEKCLAYKYSLIQKAYDVSQ